MAIAPQYQQNYAPMGYSQTGYGQQFSPVQQYQPQGGGDWWDSISEFFMGTPESYDIFNKYTPQQMQQLQYLLQSGMQNQQNPYEGFEPLQQETMNNFYQSILPGIKEQFAGQRGGALSSPDFGSQLSSGASGLSAMLNAQKARYGMANRQFGLQQSQLGLQQPFDIRRREAQPGWFQQQFMPNYNPKTGENMGSNVGNLASQGLKYLALL